MTNAKNTPLYAKACCLIIPFLIGALVLPAVHLASKIIRDHTDVRQAIAEIGTIYIEPEFLMIFSFWLVPYVCLSAFLYILLLFRSFKECVLLCECGLIGILAFALPVSYQSFQSDGLVFAVIPYLSLIPLALALGIGMGILYWQRKKE